MVNTFRNFAKKNLFFRKFLGYYVASSGLVDGFFKNYKVSLFWDSRIANVLSSSDNDYIPKVADAGEIKAGKQVMHNGIKIHLGSYYGPEYAKMLLLSRGVHEPQEERIFMEVLPTLPENAVMVELGAFWSFYSMWFQKELEQAVNFMIEPDTFNLGQGKRNFKLNKMQGTFIQAFIAEQSSVSPAGNSICIDDLVKERAIPFIHMLHSDIQGYEYEMLLGAEKTFAAKKIGYVFISTHSNELHYQCLEFLTMKSFYIIASVDMNESYSEDGLIAARAPYFEGIGKIDISKRSQNISD